MVKTFNRSARHLTPERFETLESDEELPKSKRNEMILGVSPPLSHQSTAGSVLSC